MPAATPLHIHWGVSHGSEALAWCPGEILQDPAFPCNFLPTEGGSLAPSALGTELFLVASSNALKVSLSAGGDGQKGQAEVQNITFDFGEQEQGLAFPQASTE